MPSNKDSGSTLIATLAVAQSISTITDAGNYFLKLNPGPLAADEILLIQIFDKVLTGDTTLNNLVESGVVRADQSAIQISMEFSTIFESIVQITQTNGTKRTFDWAVVSKSVDANVIAISGDTTSANNLELQYDGTGLTGDNFPATQEQIGNISSGSGGLSRVQDTFTNTDGGTETNTEADTETLNGVLHIIDDSVGNTDFYYEFDLGVNAAATSILWNGYVQSNGDTAAPQLYNWGGAAFEDIDSIAGTNGTTITEMSFPAPSKYTGTGANAGKVRFGFNSSDATAIGTDRVLCVYSSIAESALVFNSGVAQSGGNNSIQLTAGAVGTNDQFRRAKVVIISGTGTGQEAIITSSVASTDTLTITPAWLTNPDSTSAYEVIPAQTHQTVRNGGYDNGFIYVDVTNGSAGTERGVNGTSTNKSSVPADARTIADNEQIRKFMISGGGNWSLDQSYTDWIFDQTNAALIDFNSQDVGGSVFFRAGITGIGTNGTTRVSFRLCGMENCTIGTASATSTTLSGTITLSAEDRYLFLDCAEGSTTPPIIDVAGDGITETLVTLGNYSGRIEIQNMTSVDEVYVSGGAHVILNANCAGGTLVRAGDIPITDNSGNVTITNGMVADTLVDTGTTLPAQITALNDVSTADVNAQCDIALADYDGPTNAEMIARTILAASYFDPATDAVANVTLTATTTTNTDMRGTDSAATEAKQDIIDTNIDQLETAIITNAAGTDVAADNAAIKAVVDAIPTTAMRGTDNAALASVCTEARLQTLTDWINGGRLDLILDIIAADTTTDIPALIAALNDISVSDVLTTQMTESYAADGVAPTLTQALMLALQNLQEVSYSGTTQTVKKLDGSTSAATYTLDDATNPTNKTRTT